MTFTPDRSQLRGLSLWIAEMYGKPHLGAHYGGRSARSHRLDDFAPCAFCGMRATNAHHVPPLSKGHIFVLSTPRGVFELRPSLFALCGSGTTGCHNGFHGGARFFPEWVWDTDAAAEAWWDGSILSDFEPHDPLLFMFGHWEVEDAMTGLVREYREPVASGRWPS